MQDENRENRTEPQEVVSWYVRPEGQEVVDCYVQPRPLPSGAAPQTPREPENGVGRACGRSSSPPVC